jgi:chorismate synthase
VAVGAIARQLLAQVETEIVSHVFSIGSATIPDHLAVTFDEAKAIGEESALHCVDADVERQMIVEIDKARDAGDTMGGGFEVIAHGVPPGLGSHVQWDRKLDGRLAQALMSIQAIKAVGIGRGPLVASLPGSKIHDEILPRARSSSPSGIALARPTNNAGGLEGGITNGEDLRVTAYMKPIATLMKPLRSVDLATMAVSPATVERSDVCAVPAAAVVGEAMVALVLADALTEKFGSDSIAELGRAISGWNSTVREQFAAKQP